jgi:hypothetical protein
VYYGIDATERRAPVNGGAKVSNQKLFNPVGKDFGRLKSAQRGMHYVARRNKVTAKRASDETVGTGDQHGLSAAV